MLHFAVQNGDHTWLRKLAFVVLCYAGCEQKRITSKPGALVFWRPARRQIILSLDARLSGKPPRVALMESTGKRLL